MSSVDGLFPDSIKLYGSPELAIWQSEEKPYLVYTAITAYQTLAFGYQIDELIIDANEGKILERYSRLHSALKRKTYTLEKKCLTQQHQMWSEMYDWGKDWLKEFLRGKEANVDSDEHAKSAYLNTGLTYWFFYHFFKRDSFDNKGAPIVSTTHAMFEKPNAPGPFGNGPGGSGGQDCFGANAFFSWDLGQIIFGEGDGQYMINPASSLDITSHEISHGVTHSESQLIYKNESGAINEAFSDIMALRLGEMLGEVSTAILREA